MRFVVLTPLAILIALTTTARGQDPQRLPDFTKDVLPILQTRCVRCHGPEKQEARIRLDNLSTDLINNRPAAENWHEVQNVVSAGEMPGRRRNLSSRPSSV